MITTYRLHHGRFCLTGLAVAFLAVPAAWRLRPDLPGCFLLGVGLALPSFWLTRFWWMGVIVEDEVAA